MVRYESREAVRPVAVVALGDPAMGDDGIALRVMGRVRPLLGEIALTGLHGPQPSRSSVPSPDGSFRKPDWIREALRPSAPNPRLQENRPSLVSVVDWIEGLAALERLSPVLENRRRVVLLDAVSHGASPGGVQHWHLERRNPGNLSLVRFYRPAREDSLDHLPFWLEDDLPVHGTDLIAIEPYRVEKSGDLSPVLRSRLASITAQVAGLLLRILEEEGWVFQRPPQPAARRRRGGRAA